jgi:hypothetical protein
VAFNDHVGSRLLTEHANAALQHTALRWETGMPPLALHYDPNATKYGLVIWPGTALVGFVIAITHPDRIAIVLVGTVFVLFGLCATTLVWRRQGDRGVVPRIGQDGILDRRLGRRLIRWNQIIAIEARETQDAHHVRYLDLHLHKTASVATSWLAFLWRLAGAREFAISDEGLNGSFNQILLAAKHFADKRKVPCRI